MALAPYHVRQVEQLVEQTAKKGRDLLRRSYTQPHE